MYVVRKSSKPQIIWPMSATPFLINNLFSKHSTASARPIARSLTSSLSRTLFGSSHLFPKAFSHSNGINAHVSFNLFLILTALSLNILLLAMDLKFPLRLKITPPSLTLLFLLSNTLIAPSFVKNLIYVRQFTKDNSCSVEFEEFI